MGHHLHNHGPGTSREHDQKRLAVMAVLTLTYMIAEVVGGYLSGSLALLADAGHMLSDVAALGLSYFAVWIAGRPPTPQHSYGYYRAEILAALVNGAALLAIAVFIFVEAVERLSTPTPIEAGWMMAIASGGLAVSLFGVALLHPGMSKNLNMQGAWLHLAADALGSLATLTAGMLIAWRGWTWADPLASIIIGVLVIYAAWNLLKEAIAVLMESTPKHLDVDAIRNTLREGPGVSSVHDLHVWTITSGMVSLSAHVIINDGQSRQATLSALRMRLHERFGLDHLTIQIESEHDWELDGHCPTSFPDPSAQTAPHEGHS